MNDFIPKVKATAQANGEARTEGVGFDRLRLAPRYVRCGVPQGAQFIREWGRPTTPCPSWIPPRGTPGSVSRSGVGPADHALPLVDSAAGYPRERISFGSGDALCGRLVCLTRSGTSRYSSLIARCPHAAMEWWLPADRGTPWSVFRPGVGRRARVRIPPGRLGKSPAFAPRHNRIANPSELRRGAILRVDGLPRRSSEIPRSLLR
jgi:hypothetical protein